MRSPSLLDRVMAWHPPLMRVSPAIGLYLKAAFTKQTIVHPAGGFETTALPPAPNYEDLDCWAAFPGKASPAETSVQDGNLGTNSVLPEAERLADVFYIHPTGHYGTQWNAAFDDLAAGAQTDQVMVGTQASAFNHVARVFAPRYRQMQFVGFSSRPEDARAVTVTPAPLSHAQNDWILGQTGDLVAMRASTLVPYITI